MVKPARTKTIATKISIEECAELERRAGDKTVSEWMREELLKPAAPGPFSVALMGELIALRTILVNALYKMANGERLTVEAMQQLIDRADGEKNRRAEETLTARGTARTAKTQTSS